MSPVEKMASKLLNRHYLKPPYDLEELVEIYGSVEYHHFPFDADGVTIGIGGEEKPQVLINTSAPETRQKFTLAHELGHIIIPWHTGTIVSHLDYGEADFDYREMESEANQFAAELLLPTSWLHDELNNSRSIEIYIRTVLEKSGTSRDAALIKIFNTIDLPVICAQVDPVGGVVNQYRSSGSPTSASLQGKDLLNEDIFSTASSEERFELGDRSYICWIFEPDEIEEIDPRQWRDVLSQILDETDSKNLQQSINAILPAKYQSNKDKSEIEICSLALQAYDGREKFRGVVAHPLFPQYVVKRVKELIAKNKT